MKQIVQFSILPFLLATLGFITAHAADRPNIVWLLSEDNSVHYQQHYGAKHGPTPNLTALAADGLTFEHAFSNSPVCSVARTTLMTGMLAPRIGFQYHRKLTQTNLPPGAKMFPLYLRNAGYYCTNNVKTDYNAVNKDVWNASSRKASWRNRIDPQQPFFHMQSFAQSHEGSLHFPQAAIDVASLKTDPTVVKVFPYHQDTELSRYTAARYHDRQTVVDAAIGTVIDRLKEDGLYENTVIFYFGDHGGVLPRSKGYLYESGLHVPLVIRVPKKYQSENTWTTGARVDGFVSFIDFAPTVLKLAGAQIPSTMDGTPFLGDGVDAAIIDKQDEAFGYADRFDEKYELVRSFRKGNFKYIRNYENFYPDSLQNNYRYRMLSFREWRAHYNQGKLNEAQSHFFKAKPVESLYDISKDPHEIHNLASDPTHRRTLLQLRSALQTQIKEIHDLSFYPENQMIEFALADGAGFGETHAVEISSLVDAVDLALLPFADATKGISKGLKSKNPRMRYWTLTACTSFGKQAKRFANTAKGLLDDKDDLVRLRAAEFLAIIRHTDPQSTIYDILASNPSGTVAAITLNTVVFLRDHHGYDFQLDSAKIKGTHEPLVQQRLKYLNKQD